MVIAQLVQTLVHFNQQLRVLIEKRFYTLQLLNMYVCIQNVDYFWDLDNVKLGSVLYF